jgi:2'-5' RNA ligase
MDTAKGTRIRCFVAVEIPEPIQALLQPVQTHLQSQIHKGTSWTKPGNFHLTLKFLGDLHSEAIHDVSAALQRATDRHPPFSIALGGIGAFPNLARPRVIWMGIKQGASTVSRLAKAVNMELAHLDFSIDNRFHPHLTLARLRTATNLEPLKNILRKYDTIVGGSMCVNEIALMQSQLHPRGAIYTPLSVHHFSVQ